MLEIIIFISAPIVILLIIGIFGIRDGLKNGFPKSTSGDDMFEGHGVNPATGLPMRGNIDSAGNPSGSNWTGTDWN